MKKPWSGSVREARELGREASDGAGRGGREGGVGGKYTHTSIWFHHSTLC